MILHSCDWRPSEARSSHITLELESTLSHLYRKLLLRPLHRNISFRSKCERWFCTRVIVKHRTRPKINTFNSVSKTTSFDAVSIKSHSTPCTGLKKCHFTPLASKNNVRTTGVILYIRNLSECRLLRPRYKVVDYVLRARNRGFWHMPYSHEWQESPKRQWCIYYFLAFWAWNPVSQVCQQARKSRFCTCANFAL